MEEQEQKPEEKPKPRTLLDYYPQCLICRQPNVRLFIAPVPQENPDVTRRMVAITIHADGTACYGQGKEGYMFDEGYTCFDVVTPMPGTKEVPEEELQQITCQYIEEVGFQGQQLPKGYKMLDLPLTNTALRWGLEYLGYLLVECFEPLPPQVMFDKAKWPSFAASICQQRVRKARELIAAHQAGKTPEELNIRAQELASLIRLEKNPGRVVNVGGEISGSAGMDSGSSSRGPENR